MGIVFNSHILLFANKCLLKKVWNISVNIDDTSNFLKAIFGRSSLNAAWKRGYNVFHYYVTIMYRSCASHRLNAFMH